MEAIEHVFVPAPDLRPTDHKRHLENMAEELPFSETWLAVVWALDTIAYYERAIKLLAQTLREADQRRKA